jgi:Ca-activated chloride channel family protein
VQLHDPWLLALLLVLPLLLRVSRRQRPATLRYPLLDAVHAVGPGARTRWRWLSPVARVIAFALLVVALARPQLGKASSQIATEGIDILIAADISGSMLAEDFTVGGQRANRLQALKSVVRTFLEKRAGDRVGLVLFAARPYTQCPLTLDHGWLLQNLDRAEVGLIEDGTAVGSALATAVSRLETSDAKNRIVILLTDGQSNAGKVSPLTAAEAAKTLGYKVYTIGIGTRGVAPYPATDMFGNKAYRPMPVDIDEDTLKKVAEVTGGRYFRATDTPTFEQIYDEIDQLEKSPYQGLQYLEYDELYVWLAIPAFLLLAGEAVLSATWLRVLP